MDIINIACALDDQLRKESLENQRGNNITASMIGGCLRALILHNRKAEALTPSSRSLRVFAIGYLFEAFILDRLEKADLLMFRQKQCTYKGITGTCDAVLKTGELIDIKSCHTAKFNYLPDEVDDEIYALQQTLYATALNVSRARLIYVSKDDLRMKSVYVPIDKWLPVLDKKIDTINAAVHCESIPEEKELDWKCFSVSEKFKTVKIYCKFIKHCPLKLDMYYATCKRLGVEPNLELA